MPLIVNDVIEVAISGTQTGKAWTNVLHVRHDRPISSGNAGDVAQEVLDAYVEELLPLMSELVTVTGAEYVDLDSAEGDTGSVTPSAGLTVTGGDSAQPVPINTAVLVRKNTEGGRAARNGRMFLPGMAEVNVDGAGIIASVSRTAWQTAADAFLNTVNDGGIASPEQVMVVVSRPTVSATPGTFNEVTSLNVSSLMATQRERMRR